MYQPDKEILFNVYCNEGAKLLTAVAKNAVASVYLSLLFALFLHKLNCVHGAGTNAFAATNAFVMVDVGLGAEKASELSAHKIGKLI